jgi:F-type H+-transporting ATPase subunit delta
MKLEVLLKYVEALLSSLAEPQDIDKARLDLQSFLEVYQGSEELSGILLSPFRKIEDKIGILQQLGEKMGFLPRVVSALVCILRNDRLTQLPRIVNLFDRQALHKLGREAVTVFCAHELTVNEKQALEAKIEQEIKCRPEAVYKLDRDLIGGYVVRIGNRVFDYSIRGRMEALEQIVFKMKIR